MRKCHHRLPYRHGKASHGNTSVMGMWKGSEFIDYTTPTTKPTVKCRAWAARIKELCRSAGPASRTPVSADRQAAIENGPGIFDFLEGHKGRKDGYSGAPRGGWLGVMVRGGGRAGCER